MKKTIAFDDAILERILDLSSMMITSGGEVKRVEDTIAFLCNAYGAKYTDVFTITSSIVVTVRLDDRPPITQTRRISSQKTDMLLLSRLNALSRRICTELLTADEFARELEKTATENKSLISLLLVWTLISSSFSLFFGGTYIDAIFSGIIGALLCIWKAFLSRYIANNYLIIIISSIVGGALAFLPTLFLEAVSPFYINIGNIMLLIPGIALTTSIRDMFSGDTISGLLRFAEAILVSLAIAWGFANFGFAQGDPAAAQIPIIQILTAFTGTVGFGIIFNCTSKSYLIAAVVGAFGWGITLALSAFGVSEYIAYFAATAFITLSSELLARILHCPATVFLVTALIPLVPGKSLYSTMCYVMERSWISFFTQGLATILYAVAIAAGIVTVTAFFNTYKKSHIEKNHKTNNI